MRRRDFHRSLLGGAALAGGLGGTSAKATEKALNVVATTGMIADVARIIGGDAVKVRALMGSGVDPHAYRQTRSDILALNRADLILWHGLYLEAQLEELLLRLGRRRKVVAAGNAAPKERLLAHEDYSDKFDPHIWMDPALWGFVSKGVCEALAQSAPKHVSKMMEREKGFQRELSALDAYAKRILSSVPQESRVIVTAHDAFRYFGAAYSFEVVGIQGISTESEAGVARMRELAEMLARRRIKAVFVESSVSDRNVRALIEGASALGHSVEIGGELFSDAMGPEGTYEGTYLGMMDHNVSTIASALGGEAPERGRLGRLATGRARS